MPAVPAHPFDAVERFLATTLDAAALRSAFELGLIDALATGSDRNAAVLQRRLRLPGPGWQLLVDILAAAGVLSLDDGEVDLTADFRSVLAWRDLLLARARFVSLVAADFAEHFTAFLSDLPAFMARSAVFELFRYDRCLEETPANLALARRWVDYTTVLTRYEAAACLDRLDLERHWRLLDIGGNSGEFVLQACRRHGGLAATVLDLPVVCALGRAHIAGDPAAARIRFVAGDMRSDPLPSGHDLLTFKSVLHDWPEPDMARILERSARRLEPGGRLVIFERGPLALGPGPVTASTLANLVFAPFYRPATVYTDALARLGFVGIAWDQIELDTPFHLVTARKPG